MRRNTIRFWALPAISALATMLVAANVDPSGGNWDRLRALPPEARQRLVENLQKFDMLYSSEQQRSLRDLDHRINELDPTQQVQYLRTTAHRYHNWLASLARETKQDELKAKSPGERMDMIKQLVKVHPVPGASTAQDFTSVCRRLETLLTIQIGGDLSDLANNVGGRSDRESRKCCPRLDASVSSARKRRRRSRRNLTGTHLTRPNRRVNWRRSPRLTRALFFSRN